MNEQKDEAKAAGEQAFVLRMWPASDGWQASLQEVKTGRRIGFSSLEALFTFLMDEAEQQRRRTNANPIACREDDRRQR